MVHFHDGLGSAIGEQAVEAVIGIVVNDVVDALKFFLFNHLLLVEIIHRQPAHLGIVGGIDQASALAVQGHESRIVKLDAVNVRKFAL